MERKKKFIGIWFDVKYKLIEEYVFCLKEKNSIIISDWHHKSNLFLLQILVLALYIALPDNMKFMIWKSTIIVLSHEIRMLLDMKDQKT